MPAKWQSGKRPSDFLIFDNQFPVDQQVVNASRIAMWGVEGRAVADRIEIENRNVSLVALVPKPRVNLTCFHGVFAPHSKYRAWVTPARRGQGRKTQTPEETPDQTPAEQRASMTGFCSCKTGIHAIPGNNLGKEIEASIQYRYWPLSDFLSFAAPAHPCALKPAVNAAVRLKSSPVFDYTDVGGTSPGMDSVERSRMPEPRAMPGAIAEKTRW